MPFGNSEMNVPEGQMRIAQRFIAGCSCANETSPVRDERNRLFGNTLLSPLRPTGLCRLGIRNPRLKPCWAIIGMSLRDELSSNFRKAFGLTQISLSPKPCRADSRIRSSRRKEALFHWLPSKLASLRRLLQFRLFLNPA